ncbi:hypothetical protein F2P81_025097 [Scophthalmus maximus]|uniref:Syntaxin N-terminal domain-containing protein n=1 Tax=Scophthalmus maximus TaxID=52904 RepID=A0A6A4RRD4_SCOMX|nr:hypothetical protein F2P81_025097 [Scophthalmus maximus]
MRFERVLPLPPSFLGGAWIGKGAGAARGPGSSVSLSRRDRSCVPQSPNVIQPSNPLSRSGHRSRPEITSQQLQHYTNQLAKETNRHLKELGARPPPLSPSEQRQQKLQRERLMSDFSAALNNFQAVQRSATEKEKETVARARAGSRVTVQIRHKLFHSQKHYILNYSC